VESDLKEEATIPTGYCNPHFCRCYSDVGGTCHQRCALVKAIVIHAALNLGGALFATGNLPGQLPGEISESDDKGWQITNLDTIHNSSHQTMANTTKLASPRTDSTRRQSALPQIHKIWECFGHTFGDREKYNEDDDDTELTHNFFYGGGESALDDFDKIYDDGEYVAEERPRPKHRRQAVTSTSPICVDDFVDFSEVR
jgi:hypothetical protein